MEVEQSQKQRCEDTIQSDAALQLADFSWEGELDFETIRSFLGHFGLLKEDESEEDDLAFLDL